MGGVAWGLILVALGGAMLASQQGWVEFDVFQHGWPFFVIALGLGRTVTARRPSSIGSGVQLTLFGCWFLVATNNWHGLTWANSWPLALVAAGAGMVTRSIASLFIPKRPEGTDSHA